jgi:hypothetical protein
VIWPQHILFLLLQLSLHSLLVMLTQIKRSKVR